MTTLSEGKHVGEFLLDYTDEISFDKVSVAASQGALVSGTVMGKKSTVAVTTPTTGTADGGNAGANTMTGVAAGAEAKAGTYTAVCVDATTGGSEVFQVTDPDGLLLAPATVAVPYVDAQIHFTINDPGANAQVGDAFTVVAVAAAVGDGSWIPYDADATDGSQVAKGILYSELADVAAVQAATIVARLAEAKADELTGLDAAARVQLAALNIICRD